jgi:hypothetical protein
VLTFGCIAMSAKKKENEDSVVTFKQAPGQSKDDA